MGLPEFNLLPPWAKRLIQWGSVVGVVIATTMGLLNIYDKIATIRRATKDSYQTLAPAVNELQELVRQMGDRVKSLEDARAASVPVVPLPAPLPQPTPEPLPAPPVEPQAEVPDSLDQAQRFQGARKELGCSSSDPGCGAVLME